MSPLSQPSLTTFKITKKSIFYKNRFNLWRTLKNNKLQPFHSHHTSNLSNLTLPNHSSCDVLTIFIVCWYLKQASESLRRRKIMQLNVKRINVEWIRKIISSLSFNRKIYVHNFLPFFTTKWKPFSSNDFHQKLFMH